MKNRPIALMVLGALVGIVLVLGIVATVMATTGDGDAPAGAQPAAPSEPIPLGEIDQDAWMADLAELDSDPLPEAIPRLHELIAADCERDTRMLAMQLTMKGADPAVDRVNFRYVCPSQVSRIDDALAEIDSAMGRFNRVCTTPPDQRTDEEQDLVDAMADPSCL